MADGIAQLMRMASYGGAEQALPQAPLRRPSAQDPTAAQTKPGKSSSKTLLSAHIEATQENDNQTSKGTSLTGSRMSSASNRDSGTVTPEPNAGGTRRSSTATDVEYRSGSSDHSNGAIQPGWMSTAVDENRRKSSVAIGQSAVLDPDALRSDQTSSTEKSSSSRLSSVKTQLSGKSINSAAQGSRQSSDKKLLNHLSRNNSLAQQDEEALPLQFGEWTPTMEITTFDGQPSCTSTDNKSVESVPSVRGGIAVPLDAKAEWHFRLEQAKGMICMGVQKVGLKLGDGYRKPEHRDMVWYYTNDGILRNGARSVGKKGVPAQKGDVVTMKLANRTLTFRVNDVAITDGIPKLDGASLYFGIQIHRKGDCVTLIKEKFDPTTTLLIKHFSWGRCAQVAEGPLVGHPSVRLERQLTMAISAHKGSDTHLGMVPAVRGAKVLSGIALERAVWNIQIGRVTEAVYIGLQSDDWKLGMDWWCDAAIDNAWYYASNGSVRNGNRLIARGPDEIPASDSKDKDKKPADSVLQLETPKSSASRLLSQAINQGNSPLGKVSPASQGGSPFGKGFEDFSLFRLKSKDVPSRSTPSRSQSSQPEGPYVPPLKEGDILTVHLEGGNLSFAVNQRVVDGVIRGVRGKVRLAAQFEHEGDNIIILPH